MITSLRIQNFKAWRDTGEMRLAPITGLFGANSSGKTSILQLLLMLKQTVEASDRNQVLNFGDEKEPYVRLGTFRDVVHRDASGKPSGDLEWSLTWRMHDILVRKDPDDSETALKTLFGFKPLFAIDVLNFQATVGEISTDPGADLVTKRFQYDFTDALNKTNRVIGMQYADKMQYRLINTGFDLKRVPGRPELLPKPVKCYGFPHKASASYRTPGLQSEAEPLFSDFAFLFEGLLEKVYYLGPLREPPERQYTWGGEQPSDVGRRGENAVAALLASRKRNDRRGVFESPNDPTVEEQVALWLRELELIHDFKVERISEVSEIYRVQVQRTPDSAFVSLSDVGFGVSQILPIIALCYYVPASSTVLLEQPEAYLHPAVQAGLADMLIAASRKRNLQIILESHSEHLLARFQRRMAENGITEQGYPASNVALYFCEREGAEAKLRALELDEFGNISNWPKDFFGDELSERAAMIDATIERQKRENAA